MFDFAFSELALIGVVALVVIGPERLPRVARTAGVVVGRLQRYAATVKADIAREVELSELRRVQGEIKDAAQSFESSMRDSLASAETHFMEGRQALMTGPAAHHADTVLGVSAGAPAADLAAETPARAADLPVTSAATRGPVQTSLFSAAEAPPGDSAGTAPPAHPE